MTATMGIVRNLKVHEIVGQVVAAIREAREANFTPVRNVVFMGMGEPLDNLNAVEKALEILTDDRALGLSPNILPFQRSGFSAKATAIGTASGANCLECARRSGRFAQTPGTHNPGLHGEYERCIC